MGIIKYLRYLGIALWTIFAKSITYIAIILIVLSTIGVLGLNSLIVGLAIVAWLVLAYVLRHWSASIVFSYTLQNGLYLQRLTNEPGLEIKEVSDGWQLKSYKYTKYGFVKNKNVNWLTYQLVFWLLWGWTDNDCDRDTIVVGYGRNILEGKHFASAPVWFLKRVAKEQAYLELREDGNAFALGNNLQKTWVPLLSTLWMFRNLAYNFNYALQELPKDSKWQLYVKFPSKGWHFGFIPYDAKERHGRMVWFSEDYANIYN